MSKVAVMTDSNSGITQIQAKEFGIVVLPMPFFINEELFLEDITLSQEEFYKRLGEDADISTSQPAPADVMDAWDKLLEEYEEVVYIPMSSGLSSSCETAIMLADDYEGKVQIVNNQRIAVTQRRSVLDAMELAEDGKSATEIKTILEDEAFNSSIYITVETLKYLKKGGRITPVAAAIGSVLNLKPVLQIQGEKLDAYAKVRGKKAARRTMLEAMKKDIEERFADKVNDKGYYLQLAYSGNEEEALDWKAEVEQVFTDMDIVTDPLSLSIACHIGHGALAIACSMKVR